MGNKYTVLSSASNSNRISTYQTNKSAIQLSDGTFVFAVWNPGTSHWDLMWTSDHTTINTLASNPLSYSGPLAICRDNSDNIYLLINGSTSQLVLMAFTKGTGYTWTAQSMGTVAYSGYAVLQGIDMCWCNTGGGTSNAGHLAIVIQVSGSGGSGNPCYFITLAAGAVLTGGGNAAFTLTASLSNPACMGNGGGQSLYPISIAPDGFGGTSGLVARASGINSGYANATDITIGAWAISNTGTLTTNTLILTTATGQAPSGWGTWNPNRMRLIRYAAGAWAVLHPDSNGNITCHRYSSSAQLTSPTTSGAITGKPTFNVAGTNVVNQADAWDAVLDPSTANKIWVYFYNSSTPTTVQRLGVSVAGGVTWDAALTQDDTAFPATATWNAVLQCAHEVTSGSLVDYIGFTDNAGTYALVGDNTQFNVPPNAPTLTAPANGAIADLAAGTVAFTWTFSDPNPGDTQSAWAMRIKQSGGAYQYVNASNNTLQSTIVWNAGSAASYTPPAAMLLDGGQVYNWSVATQDNHSAQGPFATDNTVTGSIKPSVSVTAPSSTTTIAQPNVSWSFTPGVGGNAQASYRVVIESGAYGSVPGSGTSVFDSGVVSDANARSRQAPALSNNVTYRAFVQCVESNSNTSSWAFSTFTEAFDFPAAPVVSLAYDAAYNRTLVGINGQDNLLTYNQASFENGDITGWSSSPAAWPGGNTSGRSATGAQALNGAYSMMLTAYASGQTGMNANTTGGTGGAVVLAGATYTAMLWTRAASVARNTQVQITFYDSGGTALTSPTGTQVLNSTTGWTQAILTTVAPANAAYAAVYVLVLGVAAGEVHYVDQAGLFQGTVSTWTRGGLTGGQSVLLQYSDDSGVTWKTVRGAATLTPAGAAQYISIYDYEATPQLARRYRAQISALNGQIVSPFSSAPSITTNPTKFWLKYPKGSALNMVVNIDIPLPHTRPETQTTFAILGKTRPVVGADALLGHQSSGITIHTQTLAEWNSLQALLATQDTLLLQSPFGEQWYIRMGGAGTSGTGHRTYELHGPDASDVSNQYRKIVVGYVEVDMPPTS